MQLQKLGSVCRETLRMSGNGVMAQTLHMLPAIGGDSPRNGPLLLVAGVMRGEQTTNLLLILDLSMGMDVSTSH